MAWTMTRWASPSNLNRPPLHCLPVRMASLTGFEAARFRRSCSS
jgi:hypothetical protein